MQRKGFFARLADLWRGFWGVKLSDALSVASSNSTVPTTFNWS